MPDNRDINPHLTEQMMYERTLHNGLRLFRCPAFGHGVNSGAYLYRSMSLAEAINWFDDNWLPSSSGIPWSTNHDYSRDNYLDGASPVQLEVSAYDVLPRLKAAGAVPKFEGNGETWGTGPAAEIGRTGSSGTNKELKLLYKETQNKLSAPFQGASGGQVIADAKFFQNEIFRSMFKDKIWTARVVARLFPAE